MEKKTVLADCTYLLRHIANSVAIGFHYYPNWTTEFCLNEAQDALKKVQEKINWEDLMELPTSDLCSLGFGNWDNLLLIPIYLWNVVPNGTVLYSINGHTVIKGREDFDLDVRYGCLAYGILKIEEILPKESVELGYIR